MGTGRFRPAYRVNALAFSPDGTLLASVGQDRVLSVWDVSTGRERRRITDAPGVPDDVRFSDDGRTVSAPVQNGVRVWDVETGKERQRLGGQMEMGSPAAGSADGKLLAAGSGKFRDASIGLWETPDNRLRHRLEGHQKGVRSLAFAPDGKVLASGGADGAVRLWDIADGKELHTLTGHAGGVRLLVFAPDGKTLASVGDDGTVRLWDVATGRQDWTYPQHLGYGRALAFTPDGQTVALGENSGWVELLAAATGKSTAKWRVDRRMVVAVAYSPDGKQLATIGLEGPIHLWDSAGGKELTKPEGHQEPVARLACTPDGKALLTSSGDGTVRRWDAATGKEQWRLDGIGGPGDEGKFIAFAPDGRTFVTARPDRVLRVFDSATGQELRPLLAKAVPDGGPARDLLFSPDSKLLAVGYPDFLKVYDPSNGAEVRSLRERHLHGIRMAFSPDSRFLVSENFTGGALGEVELATGRAVRSFNLGGTLYTAPVFSPDGRTFGVCATVLIELWEVGSGNDRAHLGGPHGSPRVLAFSPDGRLLASGNEDRTVRLWDLATGKEVHKIEHPGVPTGLAWLPGGQALASGSTDGTALVWDLKEVRAGLRPHKVDLAAKELEALWKDLTGADAMKAYEAVRTLSAGGRPAVQMLEERTPSLGAAGSDRAAPVRVVEILERMGTPDARRLLDKLAREATDARLAEEAKAALERMGR
jgi:WD40 repeat protein